MGILLLVDPVSLVSAGFAVFIATINKTIIPICTRSIIIENRDVILVENIENWNSL